MRTAIYAWGGPGTIRLLRTKYQNPRIDESSFNSLYSSQSLERMRALFSITDAFVTYSWGFCEKTEQEDYAFLRKHLPSFHRLGVKTHAYVQGLNVVRSHFADSLHCTGESGEPLPYSRGRVLICPNNPSVHDHLCHRVDAASSEEVDGVFIDNLLFGLPPLLIASDAASFFGCACAWCKNAWSSWTDLPFESRLSTIEGLHAFLSFRSASMSTLLTKLSKIAHQKHKEFGVNLYDPMLRLDTLYYGYSLDEIQNYLSYFLIENHSLPVDGEHSNHHLLPLLQRKKETFVVSYHEGIGFEPQYQQVAINAIFSEASLLRYSPCLKATEFTTNGIWHALKSRELTAPTRMSLPTPRHPQEKRTLKSTVRERIFMRLLSLFYPKVLRILFELGIDYILLKRSETLRRALYAPKVVKI